MVLSVRPDVSGRADKIILPGLPAVGDGLLHLWTSGHTRLSASGSKEQRKRKIIWKAVKAPLWHKHKRNGPCLISLNCCLGVRQSPFLRLCDSRHTFVQNLLLGDGVPTNKAAFTEKLVWDRKNQGDSYQNLPFYCYFCIRRVLWRLRNAQKNNAADN